MFGRFEVTDICLHDFASMSAKRLKISVAITLAPAHRPSPDKIRMIEPRFAGHLQPRGGR